MSRPADDTDITWSGLDTSMEHIQQGSAEFQAGQAEELHEELPPSLGAGGRSETINSHTAYASLSEIQPRNTYNYTGITVADLENNSFVQQQQQQTQGQGGEITLEDVEAVTGVKREHEGEAERVNQCKVIIVDSSGNTTEEYSEFSDPFEVQIPLGGSAETEAQGHQARVVWARPQVQGPAPASSVSGVTMIKVPEHQMADTPRPTSVNPSTDDWPGHHMFDVSFTKWSQGAKNKHWDYSPQLKKLFIDMNRWVQVEFRVGASISPGELFIRALPIYCDASSVREPVRRCPNHASPSDQTNANFSAPLHLIRLDNDYSEYCTDEVSGRLSVRFPVQQPHEGTDRTRELLKFMCLGSDVGGINRRPLKVIFSLETAGAQVLGRKVFDVRICSCPRRDKAGEEERMQTLELKAKTIADRLATSTLVVNQQSMPPPGKKAMKKNDKARYIMVPVYVDDFKSFNNIAESSLIAREVTANPSQAETIIRRIKEERVSLMREHNPQYLKDTNSKRQK